MNSGRRTKTGKYSWRWTYGGTEAELGLRRRRRKGILGVGGTVKGMGRACGKMMGRYQLNWKGKWEGMVRDRIEEVDGLEGVLEDAESLREMFRHDLVGS